MIALHNLSKSFRRGGSKVQILRGVSFELPDQSGIALLGRNGAGKSTLLRLIAGSLAPDGGRVERKGSISWPMGFAGGFHPSLTGAQNARFVARVHGLDPEALSAFVEGYAELGAAFWHRVETYSTGMRARLAFATSIGVDFDMYLVDEIIGVGDDAFRRKCQRSFRQRLRTARLLMVSHNRHMLREFCQSALLLEKGQLFWFPSLEDGLDRFDDVLGLERA
ncbi:MAG: ABC transporter ATP-binding protein [Pseudomonadota bacterium]